VSPKLTRYVIADLLRPFAFFVVVFTGVIWLSQSLRVLETVINAGGGTWVLLEFSALLLPQVMSVVLPVSAFGAALYAVNKLFVDSELVAMAAAGLSPSALARPVALFGAVVLVAMAGVTLILAPLASRELRDQIALIRADIASGLLFEGQFLNPSPGLTIYVRESDGTGSMRGVFVHDRRDPDAEVTYTARQALLNRGEQGAQLVMFDGTAQRFVPSDGSLSLLRFESLVYDLSPFMTQTSTRLRRPSERFIHELIFPDEALRNAMPLGRLYAEGHDQASAPLYALALPLIALAGIVGGGFTRHGYASRIAATALVGLMLRLSGVAIKAAVGGSPWLWPALYLPPLVGIAAALWYLHPVALAGPSLLQRSAEGTERA
jgi:lipopolysaccharide export system permease protein